MRKIFGIIVAVATLGTPVLADQVEIEADTGERLVSELACGVKIVAVGPDVEKIFVGDQVIAVITLKEDHSGGRIESFADGIKLEEYAFTAGETAVEARNRYIDRMLGSFGLPPMIQLDETACLA